MTGLEPHCPLVSEATVPQPLALNKIIFNGGSCSSHFVDILVEHRVNIVVQLFMQY